jgi:hypothetical protein
MVLLPSRPSSSYSSDLLGSHGSVRAACSNKHGFQDDVTPLDEYVQTDDGFYHWEYLLQHEYEGVTVYMVNMTSQQYQDGIYHPLTCLFSNF